MVTGRLPRFYCDQLPFISGMTSKIFITWQLTSEIYFAGFCYSSLTYGRTQVNVFWKIYATCTSSRWPNLQCNEISFVLLKKNSNKQRKHLMKWHIYIIKMWLYMYIFVDIKICIYTKQIWHSHMKMPSNCSPTHFFVIDKITISHIHSMLWLFQIHSG